jgi:hypothetical protein
MRAQASRHKHEPLGVARIGWRANVVSVGMLDVIPSPIGIEY